ncbi:hypothetical protein CBER1_10733 [Cercospora berteroae]|uniref:1,3-beta-glucanosyltransferase n=1 Tax=Cercospora berteroae TaxID=357750 RepID=A0A2S6CKW4_9PEZI|nr:hypothetical protein CBER1_10733 [Cercospora berteroae]
MSDLAFRSQSSNRPAFEPIRTKGNQFWRGDERFLIKGINYFKQKLDREASKNGIRRWKHQDALANEQLDELREDLEILQELGINTLLVPHLDPTKDYQEALNLLAEKGFYLVVEIGTSGREILKNGRVYRNTEIDLDACYTFDAIQNDLRLVDQLADFQNVLGFMVAGDCINRRQQVTRFAAVLRAFVRDAKAFLRLRGGRIAPVGISNPCLMDLRLPALKYFTAGSREERVDFFAPQDYSWCGPSNFKISGWQRAVEILEHEDVRVPMFLAEFGCNTHERIWDEVACLYGEEMLGAYSGGCVYCFEEYWNGYGVVKRGEDGRAERKREFETLKGRLQEASRVSATAMSGMEPRDYENWTGEFPGETRNDAWMATSALPCCPGDLAAFVQELRDEREWDVVERVEGLGLEDE